MTKSGVVQSFPRYKADPIGNRVDYRERLLPSALAGAPERLDVPARQIDGRTHGNRVADVVRKRGFGPLAQRLRGDQPVSRELQDIAIGSFEPAFAERS